MPDNVHGSAVEGNFRQRNVFSQELIAHAAHGGVGQIQSCRIASFDDFAGLCNFIDYAELAPGTSIGEHRHASDSEELYLVLSGSGRMRLEDELLTVAAGDLVRNSPGGLHGLTNTGSDTLRLLVIELLVG